MQQSCFFGLATGFNISMWLRAIHIFFIQFKAVFFFPWQFSCLWPVLLPSLASSTSGSNQPLFVQTESYVQPGNLRMTASLGPQHSFLGLSAPAWWVKSSLTDSVNEKAICYWIWRQDEGDFGFVLPSVTWKYIIYYSDHYQCDINSYILTAACFVSVVIGVL